MIKKRWSEIATLAGLVLGIFLGVILPEGAEYFAFIGQIFLALLKVLILPIIIVSLFLAIVRIPTVQGLKSLGYKTIGYYFLTSVMAVATGLLMANLFIFTAEETSDRIEQVNTKVNVLDRIFSTNIFNSLAEGEILHVVIFTLLLGIAVATLPNDRKSGLIALSETVYEAIMKVIGWVIKMAPVGVLSLVWTTVSAIDREAFTGLTNFFIATGLAAIIHSCITLPLIGRYIGKFNPIKFAGQVKQALIVSLATASSSATLPVSTKVLEDNGVDEEVVGFVLPLGATLNMDGSALYQALLAMLFVNLSGVEISLSQQILVFVFIILSSAGSAGIPSGGIVMMTMVIQLLNIPDAEYYLGIYILVDRFWDYIITTINVWGDLIGTKTIDSLLKIP